MTQDLSTRVVNDLGFHAATDITRPKHEEIRAAGISMAHTYLAICPPSRELSLALTALQEAQMWANAAVAVNLAPLEEK